MNPDSSPALLTKTELDWLNGNIQLSYAYQRKIKSDIKKKIRILQELELPLLIDKGFIPELQALQLIVTMIRQDKTSILHPFYKTKKPWPGF